MVTALNYTDYLYRPRRPEELDPALGGGVVLGQAAHQVDVVCRLVGAPVVRVRAPRRRLGSRPAGGRRLHCLPDVRRRRGGHSRLQRLRPLRQRRVDGLDRRDRPAQGSVRPRSRAAAARPGGVGDRSEDRAGLRLGRSGAAAGRAPRALRAGDRQLRTRRPAPDRRRRDHPRRPRDDLRAGARAQPFPAPASSTSCGARWSRDGRPCTPASGASPTSRSAARSCARAPRAARSTFAEDPPE